MFSAAAGRFQCPRCKRRFPTQEEMEDHRHRSQGAKIFALEKIFIPEKYLHT